MDFTTVALPACYGGTSMFYCLKTIVEVWIIGEGSKKPNMTPAEHSPTMAEDFAEKGFHIFLDAKSVVDRPARSITAFSYEFRISLTAWSKLSFDSDSIA